MARRRRALGLMSGTSMDGIDLAMLETDGTLLGDFGPTAFRPYSEDERAAIRTALGVARFIDGRDDRPPALAEAEEVVTRAHAQLLNRFLREHGYAKTDIDVVGFHGQTVLHAPDRGLTVQLGNADALAQATGMAVVTDLRLADVVSGGEGAPLVPAYHRALADRSGLPKPVVVLNVGGVANATWIGAKADELVAFDTGPGNALIDDFVARRTGAAMDADGACAARGRVDETLLAHWLDHPYFNRRPPKSLDRDAFLCDGLDRLSVDDGCATLTAFTAATVARGLRLLPAPPAMIVVVGGGARNRTLMAMLHERTGRPVSTGQDVGWDGDFIEAQAFAYLAVRSLEKMPLTFPGTTGVGAPQTGGRLVLPGAVPV